jgi:Fe-S cluster biogenesis protein NfuA
VTALTARVTAALERSVLPSVIARGGAVRVASAEAGLATLEVTGSPGAVFPLASRIEAVIRAAVPEITGVRLITPGAAPLPSSPGAGDNLARAAQQVLDTGINPAVAAHHGHVTVTGAAEGWVQIRFEGGCQGCSLAEVTLRQGIEPLLREHLPGMTGLIDLTDHEAGTEPYFSPEKR